jgi:hypothetical protein
VFFRQLDRPHLAGLWPNRDKSAARNNADSSQSSPPEGVASKIARTSIRPLVRAPFFETVVMRPRDVSLVLLLLALALAVGVVLGVLLS